MIAKNILLQLGGKRFAKMSGSTDFIDMGDGIRMHLAKYEDVFSDMLQNVFTEVTGLYTHF